MLNYAVLRDIQKKESDSAAIVRLEPSFYSDAAQLISQKKADALESGSIMSIKEYENLRKIVASIQSRREEKIVLMAVRGERDTSGLTEDEGRLLGELAERIGESRLRVAGIWNGKSDDGQKSRPRGAHPGETAVLSRKVRILKDIEPYTGLDKNVYGPFRIGEERSLPMPEAEWLLKSRLAEPL